MYLELLNLKKTFGEKEIIQDLSLSMNKGELLCILGSSGCGKTTALNMIGGFLFPDDGKIILDGEDITLQNPEYRPVTTVFQSYGLFPHMTVLQNVIYGLKFRGINKDQATRMGIEYLNILGLSDYAEAPIYEISRAQQQMVALARSLIVGPKLCLLDEPFSNLDPNLREKMRGILKKLQKKLKTTMIFVTHDQEEAMLLGDKIAIMNQGKVMQCDTPENIYIHPSCSYVREFINFDRIILKADGTLIKVLRRQREENRHAYRYTSL